MGTITNITIFYILVDIYKINPTLIATVNFFIAGFQNYILNHFWTFRSEMINKKISLSGYFKFILTCFSGLLINILVLNLIIIFFNIKYKVIAQAFGILAGMFVNYLGSKYFVFKKYKID